MPSARPMSPAKSAKPTGLVASGVLVTVPLLPELRPLGAALGSTSNNWLGRAQFNDPLFRGQFDEFRIWDNFMLPSQVAASFAAGPSTAPVQPRLTIVRTGDSVTVSWPDWASFGILEESTNLNGGWVTADAQLVQENGMFKTTLPIGSTPKFFRLVP